MNCIFTVMFEVLKTLHGGPSFIHWEMKWWTVDTSFPHSHTKFVKSAPSDSVNETLGFIVSSSLQLLDKRSWDSNLRPKDHWMPCSASWATHILFTVADFQGFQQRALSRKPQAIPECGNYAIPPTFFLPFDDEWFRSLVDDRQYNNRKDKQMA